MQLVPPVCVPAFIQAAMTQERKSSAKIAAAAISKTTSKEYMKDMRVTSAIRLSSSDEALAFEVAA